jgi:hypothetical protein
LTAKEHFEHIQQHKLHRGHQHPFRSRQTPLLKRLHHAQFFQKHKKLIQQPSIAEFMHCFNVLTCIQSLRDLCIISPRQLPVQSFLHDAGFLGRLGGLLLALHAFVPFPSSLFPQPITFSPLPTTPYIKTSVCIEKGLTEALYSSSLMLILE